MPKASQVKKTIKSTIDAYLRAKDDTSEFKNLCAALLELCYSKESLVNEVITEYYSDRYEMPKTVKAFKKLLLSHLAEDMKTANVFTPDADHSNDDEEQETEPTATLPSGVEDVRASSDVKTEEVVGEDGGVLTAPELSVKVFVAHDESNAQAAAVQPKSGGWFMNALWSVVTLGLGSTGSAAADGGKQGAKTGEENPWAGCSENTQRVLRDIENGDAKLAGDHSSDADEA